MPILSRFLRPGIRPVPCLSITSNESWVTWFTPHLMLKTYGAALI
jgi:hypothetical protein